MAFEDDSAQSTDSPHVTQYEVPNFVWPLKHQHRMQAREEERPIPRPSNDSPGDSDESISQITKARIRGKTQAILEGLVPSQDPQTLQVKSRLESVSSVQHRRCHILDLPREEQIEKIAYTNARSQAEVETWQKYLDCYTKGSLNLLKPQNPPEWGDKFQFLSALHPPNEAQRMAISARYSTGFTQLFKSERVGSLVKKCLEQLGVRYGSLSFFDNNYENIKMESGYHDHRINREISIAAHALYSSEVLVVPDTHLDWRFERNPLVARKPKVRSFAAAPLISANGEVFAVLAIFEKRPRNFTAEECELLAGYSAEMVKELDPSIEQSFRTTPLLERDSVIEGKYAHHGINSPLGDFSTGRVESQYLPPPLNLRPRKLTSASSFRNNLCNVNKIAGDLESTPLPYAESSNNFFDPLCPRASTPGFYSTSSLTTVPLRSPRTSPLGYRNAAELASLPDLDYVANCMSPWDKEFPESKRELWRENQDNLVDKCIRSHRMGARPPQVFTPMDNPNTREDEAAVAEISSEMRNLYLPHHQQPLMRAQTGPFQAGPSREVPRTDRAQIDYSEPCPFPANEAREVICDNQNNQPYSKNHLQQTSEKVAGHTEVPADQYPRPLERGPPIVQRNEKLRKLGKLVGIIGTGGYV